MQKLSTAYNTDKFEFLVYDGTIISLVRLRKKSAKSNSYKNW
ncbi:hypothetical protein BH10CHL1_BH10CHL1_02000 [soil metagenome]